MADGGNVIFKFLGDDSNLTKSFKSVSSMASKTIKALAGLTASVGAGVSAMAVGAVNARAEFEQLEGGIQSIFGGIEQGQEQINKVMDLSNEAWKTLTMSSNEYMSSFMSTYPLMKADIEDQNEAIDKTNRIIKLNSDLANTFGYSMETASNAVNWALKGTFSYLDNLNIGIKGTKEGFLKAAKEAGYSVKKVGDISKLSSSDILDILEKAADKYGVLDKTAEEASKTLTGSVASFKSAWQNFLTGTGSMGQVVETGRTAFENLKRIIEEALPDITENLREWMPEILQLVGEVMGTIGNAILENLPVILELVGTMLDSIMQAAIEHREEIAQVVAKLMLIVGEAIRAAIPYILMNAQQVKQDTLNSLIEGAKNWGKEMLYKFAEAIYNNLFKVVSALLDLKNRIAEKFNELKREAIQWGWNMLIQFAIGISNKIQNIRAKIDEIKTTIQNKFRELINSAANWGRDMLNGFAAGINERLGALRDHVLNMVHTIWSLLHFSRPEEGPLRDYETWLPDMVKGMANSLDKASPFLIDKVNSLASAMNMSPTLNGNVNNNLSPNMNVVVNNQMEIDPLGQVVNQIKTFSNGAKNDYNYGYGG